MKKRLILTAEIFFSVLFLAVAIAFAAEPGSTDDPLVAKSYVDDKINQVLKAVNVNNSTGSTSAVNENEIVNKILDELEPLLSSLPGDETGGSVAVATYVPVYAAVGQTVLGGEGTEMILRSGKADVYVKAEAGIVNVTTGQELKNGAKAPLNNMLIIPRGDGRGVKVTENAWFIIKGAYEIS